METGNRRPPQGLEVAIGLPGHTHKSVGAKVELLSKEKEKCLSIIIHETPVICWFEPFYTKHLQEQLWEASSWRAACREVGLQRVSPEQDNTEIIREPLSDASVPMMVRAEK